MPNSKTKNTIEAMAHIATVIWMTTEVVPILAKLIT